MKTDCKLSIIIPVYNVEKYLSQCIDSILNQDFYEFEIILVDDGSTDSSKKLCDDYSALDTRIRVIHKKNGGVSSARNLGLKVAKSKWVMFVDSDDYIDSDTLVSCFKYLNNQDLDILIFGIVENHCYCNKSILPNIKHIGISNDIKDALEEADRLGWLQGPCCKLFRKDIIDKIGLEFDESMSLGEDTKFSFQYLSFCSKIVLLPNCFYHYCFRGEISLTKKKHSWKYLLSLTHILTDVRVIFADNYGMKSTYYDFIRNIYASWLTYSLLTLISSCELSKRKIYLNIIRKVKNDDFMQSYRPGFFKSRQYSLYIRFPNLWYYFCLLINKLR